MGILGSRRHMMERIFNDENEPFWRSAKQMELGVIPRAQFELYASEQFTRTCKTLDADACASLLTLTRWPSVRDAGGPVFV